MSRLNQRIDRPRPPRPFVSRIILAIMGAVALLALYDLKMARGDDDPNDRPNCVVKGWPAVCHSDAVVAEGVKLAMKRCGSRGGEAIRDDAVGRDMTRGPYGDPQALARDVCR